MKKSKINFEEFMDYTILKCKSVKNKYPNLNIQESDLITVLMASFLDKFESKLSLDFYDNHISKEEIDFVIDNYDFSQIKNKITFDFIIPYEIEELETKVKIKNKGKVFIIHKNDADPFPSNPHAHWLDYNLKIDLSNGKCHHIRKYVKTLSKKEFREIREKASVLGVELPALVQ